MSFIRGVVISGNKTKKIEEEVVVAYFKGLTRYSYRGTEKNHENLTQKE
jgi:hypothetical protein